MAIVIVVIPWVIRLLVFVLEVICLVLTRSVCVLVWGRCPVYFIVNVLCIVVWHIVVVALSLKIGSSYWLEVWVIVVAIVVWSEVVLSAGLI